MITENEGISLQTRKVQNLRNIYYQTIEITYSFWTARNECKIVEITSFGLQ